MVVSPIGPAGDAAVKYTLWAELSVIVTYPETIPNISALQVACPVQRKWLMADSILEIDTTIWETLYLVMRYEKL
jgi:hypothetical protein